MIVGIDPKIGPKAPFDCVPVCEKGGNDAIASIVVLVCN